MSWSHINIPGNIPWNKGKHMSEETKQKIRESVKNRIPWNKNIKTPHLTGKNANHWKGDKVGYYGIHGWLQSHFGLANKCEFVDCLGKSKRFEWAKIKDKPYKRKREYFIQLCKQCHNKYDNVLERGWKTRKLNKILCV